MTRGAIILCGGQSARMGQDKALLPIGDGETMLQRVVDRVSQAVPAERIVCVAARDQALPSLPASVRVVRDPVPHLGPLAGLMAGLGAVQDARDVFVAGCDVPLLVPAVVERLFDRLDRHEIVAPRDARRWYPLHAVYQVSVRARVQDLLELPRRSLVALIEASDTQALSLDEFRDVDPQLHSFAPCNTRLEYERLRKWNDSTSSTSQSE